VWLKGLAAITNFDLSMYLDKLNPRELAVCGYEGVCEIMLIDCAVFCLRMAL
jgi:hypothetical protein